MVGESANQVGCAMWPCSLMNRPFQRYFTSFCCITQLQVAILDPKLPREHPATT